MASWAIIHQLAQTGHEVTVYALMDLRYSWDVARAKALLAEHGVALHALSLPPEAMEPSRDRVGLGTLMAHRWRKLVAPPLPALFPLARLGPHLRRIWEVAKPDALVMYDWGPLAAVCESGVALPRVMVSGDPDHLPYYYRWRMTPPSPTVRYAAQTLSMMHACWHRPRAMREMLATCAFAGQLAAHHARWLRRHGVPHCEYLRMPIEDDAGPQWQARRQQALRAGPPAILLVGDAGATSTRAGLRFFARAVWPRLIRALGPTGFTVRVVGKGAMPDDLAAWARHPSVRLLGYVESIADACASAEVFCIPTPIPLGVRTRAIVAFSFGCCVIAHGANALGLPELADGENALLAASGQEMAAAILRAIGDPALRERLGARARATYEANFHPAVAAARLVAEVERAIRAPQRSEPAFASAA